MRMVWVGSRRVGSDPHPRSRPICDGGGRSRTAPALTASRRSGRRLRWRGGGGSDPTLRARAQPLAPETPEGGPGAAGADRRAETTPLRSAGRGGRIPGHPAPGECWDMSGEPEGERAGRAADAGLPLPHNPPPRAPRNGAAHLRAGRPRLRRGGPCGGRAARRCQAEGRVLADDAAKSRAIHICIHMARRPVCRGKKLRLRLAAEPHRRLGVETV